ncbi:Cobalt-precorrin-6A reductase [Halomicronema hongdechloris C2206]|uniref:Cobalt-precorrin-6A reductase n=1 Tax=Halomicronema hongdechloris C2206 TaxID=1641165 RepID=A0A1Z3HS50_9CYAN|nr:cobalt-precorrin-6A reductase [Halomicronema hongdechloris]ASC73125.1 Cobalt-precorrin-6A reductase [Halomicronema hongdechloris C2206]
MECLRIWLIGGTRDSAEVARGLVEAEIPCVVTVTTPAATRLYPQAPTLTVRVGKLTREQLFTFVVDESIGAVLDASHPFAVEISHGAIATAQQHHLPYLRLERPPITLEASDTEATVTEVPDLGTLLANGSLQGERVLLTLGYRSLGACRPWHQHITLFARILPSTTALTAAFAAGFTADRLIALRPPISPDLERALWQQWQITTVVSKASGQAGGEDTKRQVAAQLGIPLLIVARPQVAYPRQTDSVAEALTICQHWSQIFRSRSNNHPLE